MTTKTNKKIILDELKRRKSDTAILIRLTATEKQRLYNDAYEASYRNVSDYVRQKLLK